MYSYHILSEQFSVTDDGGNTYSLKLIVGAAVEGTAQIVSSTYGCYCLFFKLLDSEDLDTCVFGARYLVAGPTATFCLGVDLGVGLIHSVVARCSAKPVCFERAFNSWQLLACCDFHTHLSHLTGSETTSLSVSTFAHTRTILI